MKAKRFIFGSCVEQCVIWPRTTGATGNDRVEVEARNWSKCGGRFFDDDSMCRSINARTISNRRHCNWLKMMKMKMMVVMSHHDHGDKTVGKRQNRFCVLTSDRYMPVDRKRRRRVTKRSDVLLLCVSIELVVSKTQPMNYIAEERSNQPWPHKTVSALRDRIKNEICRRCD